jgi:hypothetical protein
LIPEFDGALFSWQWKDAASVAGLIITTEATVAVLDESRRE